MHIIQLLYIIWFYSEILSETNFSNIPISIFITFATYLSHVFIIIVSLRGFDAIEIYERLPRYKHLSYKYNYCISRWNWDFIIYDLIVFYVLLLK